MRLITLADRYEMRKCVLECAGALEPFRTWNDALTFFTAVPEWAVTEVSYYPQSAGDELAKALGPVEQQ